LDKLDKKTSSPKSIPNALAAVKNSSYTSSLSPFDIPIGGGTQKINMQTSVSANLFFPSSILSNSNTQLNKAY
jgi:hypothetical protein